MLAPVEARLPPLPVEAAFVPVPEPGDTPLLSVEVGGVIVFPDESVGFGVETWAAIWLAGTWASAMPLPNVVRRPMTKTTPLSHAPTRVKPPLLRLALPVVISRVRSFSAGRALCTHGLEFASLPLSAASSSL